MLLGRFFHCYHAAKAAAFAVEGSQPRGKLGGAEIESDSTFALLAELALGLAGFAGVAAAFGGRDRSYAPVELARLRSLFGAAIVVLAVSLLVLSLMSFDLTPNRTYFWSSAVGGLLQAGLTVYVVPRAYQYAADSSASTTWWVVGAATLFTGTSLLLFGASLVLGGIKGAIVSALSIQLLYGIWIFVRLLTHRN